MILEDWHSDAVRLYLTSLLHISLQSVNVMAKSFLLVDDVTSMSLAGSRMALAHSLTHSILNNLFIKLELNFSKSLQSSSGRFLTWGD